MREKREWVRILEATIAVLIVSGAIIAVYSKQPTRGDTLEEQAYSLQRQVLEDIAIDEGLRLAVLNVEMDLPGDPNYDVLDDFVAQRIPDGFGYLLRVCVLGDQRDFCKMDRMSFSATQDYDIFVEDVLISAEIGNGSGEEVYSPKKVRVFFWEGGWPADFCRDACVGDVVGCSADLSQVVNRSCIYNVTSGCFDYGVPSVVMNCNASEVCTGTACTYSPNRILTCENRVVAATGWTDHVTNIPTICAAYDGWAHVGSISCPLWDSGCDDRQYECYNINTMTTICELNPTCGGYNQIGISPCIP